MVFVPLDLFKFWDKRHLMCWSECKQLFC